MPLQQQSHSRASCALVTAVVLLVAGCHSSTAPLGSELIVQNATLDTLGFSIVDAVAPGARDRTPTILGNFAAWGGGRVIGPSMTVVVPVDELDGYARRTDMTVFVSRVSGDRATYCGEFVLTRAQLTQRHFRIELSAALPGE